MPTDSKEQIADHLRALLEERRGAEVRKATAGRDVSLAGDDVERSQAQARERRADERLSAIDAELKRFGHEAKAPHKRAESRPATKDHESR